jgi:hypothetical protein
MERFVAFYPIVLIGALLIALVSGGTIVVPSAISAMAVPALLLTGVILAVVVFARSR